MSGIKHILTGVDNETYDVGRILAVIGTLSYVLFTSYALAHGWVWDAQDWATGLGLIFTGVGALLKLKESTEPQ